MRKYKNCNEPAKKCRNLWETPNQFIETKEECVVLQFFTRTNQSWRNFFARDTTTGLSLAYIIRGVGVGDTFLNFERYIWTKKFSYDPLFYIINFSNSQQYSMNGNNKMVLLRRTSSYFLFGDVFLYPPWHYFVCLQIQLISNKKLLLDRSV